MKRTILVVLLLLVATLAQSETISSKVLKKYEFDQNIANVYIICIEGYKYIWAGAYRATPAQMFKFVDSSYPPQPIMCN